MATICAVSAMCSAAFSGCDAPPGQLDRTKAVTSALTLPMPGQTITLDFKTDAMGNPLSRGTVLAEQYANWGIHFQGGYVLGDRTVDFPEVTTPAPDNLICTYEGSLSSSGRCAGGPSSASVPLVVTFDFPVCGFSATGSGLATIGNFGRLYIEGDDASGGVRDVALARDILNSGVPNPMGGFTITVGTGASNIPQTPTPVVGGSRQGLDVHRVVLTEQMLAAIDTFTIVVCKPVIPRCKNKVICLQPSAGCALPPDTTIDDGSYAWTGAPVSVVQNPSGPFVVGTDPIPATLTVTQGSESETCAAGIRGGDCQTPPALTCPPPTTVECTPLPTGCTIALPNATAVAPCGAYEVSGDQSCFPLGTTQVNYATQGIAATMSSCSSSVTVVDTQPPQFAQPGGYSAVLPVDDAFHTVTLSNCTTISDVCDGEVPTDGAAITCVTSNEPIGVVNGLGDIQIIDAQTVQLRGHRDPRGQGRVYTIFFEIKDRSGNVGVGTCEGVVPIDASGATTGPARGTVCRDTGGAGGQGGFRGSGGMTGTGGNGGTFGGTGGAIQSGDGGSGGAPGTAGAEGVGGRGSGGAAGPGSGGYTGAGGLSSGAGGATGTAGGTSGSIDAPGGIAGGPDGTAGSKGGAAGARSPAVDAGAGHDAGADQGSSYPDASMGGGPHRGGCDVGASGGYGGLALAGFAAALSLLRRRRVSLPETPQHRNP
jgi:hypothetical protein